MRALHLQLCGADSYCLDGFYLLDLSAERYHDVWELVEPHLRSRFSDNPPRTAALACSEFQGLRPLYAQRDLRVCDTAGEYAKLCQELGYAALECRTGFVSRRASADGWTTGAYRVSPGVSPRLHDAPESTHAMWRMNTALVGNRERWSYVQLHERWLAELELEPRRDTDGSASVCLTWCAYRRARPELPEIEHHVVGAAEDMTEAYRLAMSEAVQQQCGRLAQLIETGL